MKKYIISSFICFLCLFMVANNVMAAEKKTPMGTLSAIGSGNVDLSNYAKTSDLSNYATTNSLLNYAKVSDLSGYVQTSALSNYATTNSVSDTASEAAANAVAEAMSNKFDATTGVINTKYLPSNITALPETVTELSTTVNNMALSDVSTKEIAQTDLTESGIYIWAYNSETKAQGWVKIDGESISFESK